MHIEDVTSRNYEIRYSQKPYYAIRSIAIQNCILITSFCRVQPWFYKDLCQLQICKFYAGICVPTPSSFSIIFNVMSYERVLV